MSVFRACVLFASFAVLLTCSDLACGSNTRHTQPVLDAGPLRRSEVEPNDVKTQALLVDRPVTFDAMLQGSPSKGDIDVYVVTTREPQSVDISVACQAGLVVTLEIFDDHDTVQSVARSGTDGEPLRIANLAVMGRTYVRIAGQKKGASGSYNISFGFRELTDNVEREVNDLPIDSTEMTVGTTMTGFTSHLADVDWYQLKLPVESTDAAGVSVGDVLTPFDGGIEPTATIDSMAPSRMIRITLSGTPGVAHELKIVSAAEAVLYKATSKPSEELTVRQFALRAVDEMIYVVVRSSSDGENKGTKSAYNAIDPYTLRVSLEEKVDSAEVEPNDEFSKATRLVPNGFREGFLSPKGDVDYFRIDTDEPILLKLQLTGVDQIDFVLSIVQVEDESKETILLKANEGAVKEPEQLNSVSCQGTCYVKVDSVARKVDGKLTKDDQNSELPYRLRTSVIVDDGSEEREPNQTASTSTQISLGRPIRGTIFPKKDVDFFRLDLSSRPVKTPIRATLTGILKVDVGLYLYRQEADGELTLVQSSDGAKGEKTEKITYSAEPAVYFFLVRDSKQREGNFQDSYQLTVEENID